MSERLVLMTDEEHREIDRCIADLMRAKKNERAARLMQLSSKFRFTKPLEPELPDNVVEIGRWSRKVPCA